MRENREKHNRPSLVLVTFRKNNSILFLYCFYQDSGLPSSLVPLKAQQDEDSGPREADAGQPREGEDWEAPTHPEGHTDDEEGTSYQFSETLANYFDYSNGVLRPKPQSNSILLHPRGQLI